MARNTVSVQFILSKSIHEDWVSGESSVNPGIRQDPHNGIIIVRLMSGIFTLYTIY